MASHLGSNEDFEIKHIEIAIFLVVHFIDLDIASDIEDNWLSHQIFPQIVEDVHFLEILEILPAVFLLYLLFPLQVFCDRFTSFFQIVFSSDQIAADELLFVFPKLFP